ncbi:MFS transporter, partial [Candidatus Woesearchaeota archaeon]|nr:MFS transporter [Candidatus Woesearchaeota archaeon]
AFAGLAIGFYWIGMHILFHHVSDKKHRGEECGKRRAFMVLGALLGPVVGGLLISYTSFKFLFLIAGIILFLSGGILLFNKENHVKYDFSMRRIVNKDHWKNSLFLHPVERV